MGSHVCGAADGRRRGERPGASWLAAGTVAGGLVARRGERGAAGRPGAWAGRASVMARTAPRRAARGAWPSRWGSLPRRPPRRRRLVCSAAGIGRRVMPPRGLFLPKRQGTPPGTSVRARRPTVRPTDGRRVGALFTHSSTRCTAPAPRCPGRPAAAGSPRASAGRPPGRRAAAPLTMGDRPGTGPRRRRREVQARCPGHRTGSGTR